MRNGASLHQREDFFSSCVWHRVLPDDGYRRCFATPDTWRVQHADVFAQQSWQQLQQSLGAGKVAGYRVADSHRKRWWRCVAFFDHVEVVIEGGDLVNLGHGHLHLRRERDEMCGRQAAETILNPMEMLNQEIAPTRFIAEQRAHLLPCLRIDRSTFWRSAYSSALTPIPGFCPDGHARRSAFCLRGWLNPHVIIVLTAFAVRLRRFRRCAP